MSILLFIKPGIDQGLYLLLVIALVFRIKDDVVFVAEALKETLDSHLLSLGVQGFQHLQLDIR